MEVFIWAVYCPRFLFVLFLNFPSDLKYFPKCRLQGAWGSLYVFVWSIKQLGPTLVVTFTCHCNTNNYATFPPVPGRLFVSHISVLHFILQAIL